MPKLNHKTPSCGHFRHQELTETLKAMQKNVTRNAEDLKTRFAGEIYNLTSKMDAKMEELNEKLRKAAKGSKSDKKSETENGAKMEQVVREMKDFLNQSVNQLKAKVSEVILST